MQFRLAACAVLAGLACMLGSCEEAVAPNAAPETTAESDMIECAIGPGAELAQVCTLERVSDDEFVVHHPDGGFRRFSNGEVIAARDGVDEGSATADLTDTLQFVVDEDHYMIPLSRLDRVE